MAAKKAKKPLATRTPLKRPSRVRRNLNKRTNAFLAETLPTTEDQTNLLAAARELLLPELKSDGAPDATADGVVSMIALLVWKTSDERKRSPLPQRELERLGDALAGLSEAIGALSDDARRNVENRLDPLKSPTILLSNDRWQITSSAPLLETATIEQRTQISRLLPNLLPLLSDVENALPLLMARLPKSRKRKPGGHDDVLEYLISGSAHYWRFATGQWPSAAIEDGKPISSLYTFLSQYSGFTLSRATWSRALKRIREAHPNIGARPRRRR